MPVDAILINFLQIGSALCGAAQNMTWLIVCRAVQGIGGGATYAMTQIITSDLVPLSERPKYMSILVTVYAFASGIGPVIVRMLRFILAHPRTSLTYVPCAGRCFV